MEEVMERPEVSDVEEYVISAVPPEMLTSTWPKVRHYLKKAAVRTYGRYDLDDILVSCTDYDSAMWIAFRKETMEIVGVVVTNFRQYPRKRYLDLMFIGGETGTGQQWKKPMLDMLRRWAKDNNCDGIESAGRPGWARMFKDEGYEVKWHTYELPLDRPEA
tara:strand:+ start:405 stop:887 length:483 start_codon:yes stop_codon:yes gene_type:complete